MSQTTFSKAILKFCTTNKIFVFNFWKEDVNATHYRTKEEGTKFKVTLLGHHQCFSHKHTPRWLLLDFIVNASLIFKEIVFGILLTSWLMYELLDALFKNKSVSRRGFSTWVHSSTYNASQQQQGFKNKKDSTEFQPKNLTYAWQQKCIK